MPDPARLKGSIVPLVTPFDAEGGIDWDALERLVEWQIDAGSHGISVTGTTGEPSALTLAERRQVIDHVVRLIRGRRPFVPGTGTNNLEETVGLTAHAASAGADAVLVIVPYYNRPSQEGLFRYFRAVASRADVPVIIYNIPARTGVNLQPETLARIREVNPNVIGVKESNKDFEHVSLVLHQCGRDFLLFSGIELLCLPMLALGGAGYISATANVLPGRVARIYERFSAGDLEGAQKIHFELIDINQALFLETNPGPVKWVMAEMGLIQGSYRLPLCEPSPAIQQRLLSIMSQYELKRSTAA